MDRTPLYLLLEPEEVTTANAIVYTARKFGSTKLNKLNNKELSDEEKHEIFLEVYNKAAEAVIGVPYMKLSLPMRSYISRRHGLSSDWRFRGPDTIGPAVMEVVEEPLQKQAPRAPLPEHRPDFRRKVLRHSWWYLEAHNK